MKKTKTTKKQSAGKAPVQPVTIVSHHFFFSGRVKCAADLYYPKGINRPPVILMAHGFAAERKFVLPDIARVFADHGYAVFLFDYRYFGDSEGNPRHRLSARKQIQDWEAALEHVKTIPAVDVNRIMLWGSSFSGGHVLKMAARHPEIRALIAQVPFVNGLTTAAKLGPKFIVQALLHGIADAVLCLFRKRHYVPAVGRPGTFAVMNTPESFDGYMALVPAEETRWRNRVTAACLLTLPFYIPGLSAGRIQCPALIQAGEKDSLIDIRSVRKAASRLKGGMMAEYDFSHFDVYQGANLNTIVHTQLEFLKNLG